MNDLVKTTLFAAAAVLLFGLAIIYSPSVENPEYFNDEGTLFFPEFDDPRAVKSFEVVQHDPTKDGTKSFQVAFSGSGWVIPSHQDYPADATVNDPLVPDRKVDRVARAAGLLIGLEKESIRSDDSSDLAKFGVVDPERPDGAQSGFGTKIVFRDEGGGELASLIIGNRVRSMAEDQNRADDTDPENQPLGTRFVRVPGKSRIYTANIMGRFSTRFRDWVETDLLQIGELPPGRTSLPEAEITRMVFDNYSINEETGQVLEGERWVANRVNNNWELEGKAANETIQRGPIGDAALELDNLLIVGVREKPPEIRLQDRETGQIASIPADLMERGYFLAEAGRIRANEGELIFTTNQGALYTLRFGELVFGSADEVSMERDSEANSSPNGAEAPTGQKNRYLMVDVDFDESVFSADRPSVPRLDEEELGRRSTAKTRIEQYLKKISEYKEKNGSLPATLEALTEGEDPLLEAIDLDPWGNAFSYTLEPEDSSFTLVSYGSDGKPDGEEANTDVSSKQLWAELRFLQGAQDWVAYDQKIASAKQAVARLEARFDPWYYVINAESFDKLKVSRSEVVEVEEAPEGPTAPTPSPGQ